MKPWLSLGGHPIAEGGLLEVREPKGCFESLCGFLTASSPSPALSLVLQRELGRGEIRNSFGHQGGETQLLSKMEALSLLPQTQPLPPFQPLPRARKIPERKWVLWASSRKRGFNCHLVPGGLEWQRAEGKLQFNAWEREEVHGEVEAGRRGPAFLLGLWSPSGA